MKLYAQKSRFIPASYKAKDLLLFLKIVRELFYFYLLNYVEKLLKMQLIFLLILYASSGTELCANPKAKSYAHEKNMPLL